MKVLQILPELHEGGVERHVLWLSNELAASGVDVVVVSAGGELEKQLRGVAHLRLPVHRKNPLTALWSAFRISRFAKAQGVHLLHAHSRVPAWIAWWASLLSGIPWIVTCHAFYSVNSALIPYRKPCLLLCVSEAVRSFFSEIIPEVKSCVIYNGLPPTDRVWTPSDEEAVRFLIVGRLVPKKGIDTLLKSLAALRNAQWILDVVGDGPAMDELKELAASLEIEQMVYFRGFQDEPERWMAECSCFLFPSLQEGMGLVLMRAVCMGVPVMASDLPAVRELAVSSEGLLPAGDVAAWRGALEEFLRTRKPQSRFEKERIPSVGETAKATANVYRRILKDESAEHFAK